MGVMDETSGLPTGVGGVTQPNPVAILQQITQMMNQAKQNPLPGGAGTPARPGGSPPSMGGGIPQVPGTVPAPNMSGMGASAGVPAQSGVPAARGPASFAPNMPSQSGVEFHTPGGKNAAIVQNAMKSLTDSVVIVKQKKFESEVQTARQVMGQYMKLQTDAADAEKAGDKEKAGRLRQQSETMMMDKKVQKILEKANKDPMSGSYFGVQQAYDDAQKRAMQQAATEEQQAKVKAEQALAKQREQAAWATGPEGMAQEQKNKMEQLRVQEEMRLKKVIRVEERVENGKVHRIGYNSYGNVIQDDVVPPKVSELPTVKKTTDAYGNTTTSVTTKGKVDGMSTSDRKYLRDNRGAGTIDPVITRWAMMEAAGFKSTAPKAAERAIAQEQIRLGLTPGEAPSAQAKTQASAARVLIGNAQLGQRGLIDEAIADIRTASGDTSPASQKSRADLAKLSAEVLQEVGPNATSETFISRWKERIKEKAGTIDPMIGRIDADLTSIYALAGSTHGWRSAQVAEKFKDSYGSITRRPDSLITNLDGPMRQLAELRLADGDPSYRYELMQKRGLLSKTATGNVDLTKPAAAPGGADPNDPLGLKK